MNQTLNFYDNFVPALEAGAYQIKVEQAVAGVDTQDYFQQPITQGFTVSGPQFVLDSTEIHSVFPPAGTSGQYAQVLPNVVFNNRVLPWERLLTADKTMPWLALILLQADEVKLNPQTNSPLVATTVRALLAPNDDVLKPAIDPTKLSAAVLDSPCQTLTISAAVFRAVLPRLTELAYLAHCREVAAVTNQVLTPRDTGEDLGWFAVTIGNRFPQSAVGGSRNYAHVVSLEGFAAYLVDNPVLPRKKSDPTQEVDVQLVSLTDWVFISLPDPDQNFGQLAANLVAQENQLPANLLLRLPLAGNLAPGDNTGWSYLQNTAQSAPVALQVQAASTQPGTPVVAGDIGGSLAASQLWQLQDGALINKQNGYALTVAAPVQAGALVTASPRLAQLLTQQWRWAGTTLQHVASGLLLTVHSNATAAGLLVTVEAALAGDAAAAQNWQNPAATPLSASDKVAAARLSQGYVPLSYETNGGEATFAWYRGPLTPVIAQPLPIPPGAAVPAQPYFGSSAAASIYDQQFGVFDQSYAAAWEIGRAAALADGYFSALLLRFRRASHQLADRMLEKSHLAYANVSLAALPRANVARDQVNHLLRNGLGQQLTAQLAGLPAATLRQAPRAAPSRPQLLAVAERQLELRAFVAQPAVLGVISDELQELITAIAQWLAKLNLLQFVPFNHLVPDQRLLPAESLRFFYFDQNWLNVLTDGALSVALQGTRDLTLQQQLDKVLIDALNQQVQLLRTQTTGVSTGDVEADSPLEAQSGLLLRSALVAGWPGLQLEATYQEKELKILRLERLAPDVLLAVFLDVPDTVTLSEPHQSLAFGVEDGDVVTLRSLTPPVGKSTGTNFPTTGGFAQFERPVSGGAGARVLNVNGDQPSPGSGLVPALAKALNAPIGPAALAVQLVKAPESVSFPFKS